ncbi:MAG: HetZ-related protein [Cyanobacteria bacterium P01_E01_bin.6]
MNVDPSKPMYISNQSQDNMGVSELTKPSVYSDLQVSLSQSLLQEEAEAEHLKLVDYVITAFQSDIPSISSSVRRVAERISREVARICEKSDRIQTSGDVEEWQHTLAQHRVKKCLIYYRLGSQRGRVELHSNLSAMVYRHIAPSRAQLGFQARYNLIEDFLQGFYIEVLKNFRKEHQLPGDYRPRTRIELAEYMAFTEQYAKRRISLPGRRNQQLVVLRAQAFSHRQPLETSMDIELAVESAKTEEAEIHSRSPIVQQVREQMVADAVDPADSVLRDRVITELIQYLGDQGQEDCINYLTLKLKDLPAPEIDEILELTPRQRDYLQQRFKYHVEKFACSHNWQIVHQWLGADLDQNLGMPINEWNSFLDDLSPVQRQLLELKGEQYQAQNESCLSDREIAKILNCTPKQVKRNWDRLLNLAWKYRNTQPEVRNG